MKTAISIPDEVFQAAEELARRLGVSRSHLYTQAVSVYLEAHSDERITEELNRIYSREESEIDPLLERLQVAELPPEEW